MPVFFWNDTDSSRFRAAYFDYFPGYWRHGDWIEIDAETGQCVIYGRSDSTLNRGGVRMGTSEFYRVIESIPEILEALVIDTTSLAAAGQDGQLLLFVVLREGESLTQALQERICSTIKSALSPRYVPDRVYVVPEIPHTLNGKKLEVPIKRIFQGIEPGKAVTREAMSNPGALKPFVELAKGKL
jgi:acetoacetyl-CoA synthetase